MFHHDAPLRLERRAPVLPLGKVKLYDLAMESLQLIIMSNPVLVEDPPTLMKLARDIKTKLGHFNEMSVSLADKLIDVAGTHEVQDLRVQRWQVRRETNEFIKLIKKTLQNLNCDTVSNVDTASVDYHSSSGDILTPAATGQATVGRDLKFDFSSGPLLGKCNPASSKSLTTFKSLLSPRPFQSQTNNPDQAAKDSQPRHSTEKPPSISIDPAI